MEKEPKLTEFYEQLGGLVKRQQEMGDLLSELETRLADFMAPLYLENMGVAGATLPTNSPAVEKIRAMQEEEARMVDRLKNILNKLEI